MAEAEDAGAIVVKLRMELTQIQKDALAAQKRIEELKNKITSQGSSAGKAFARGMKAGFDDVENNAAKLGRSIGAKLNPAMLAIGAGIKVIQGIGNALKDAFMSNEKFAGAIDNLKSSLGASFSAATKPVSDWFANLIEKATQGVRHSRDLKAALDSLNGGFTVSDDLAAQRAETAEREVTLANELINLRERASLIFLGLTENEREALVTASQMEAKVLEIRESQSAFHKRMYGEFGTNYGEEYALDVIGRLSEVEEKYQEALENSTIARRRAGSASDETLNKLKEAEEEYQNNLKTYDLLRSKNATTDKERDESKLSALNNYINKTAELLALENSPYYNGELEKKIELRDELRASLETEISLEEKIADARLAAMEKYEATEQRARNAQEAGLIDEIEMERQINDALASRYQDLDAIVVQYGLVNDETVRLRDATAELVKANQDLSWQQEYQAAQAKELDNQKIAALRTQAAVAKTESEKNALLQEAIDLENKLIDAQREEEKQALIKSESFKAQSKEVRDQILADFDALTEGRKQSLGNVSLQIGDYLKANFDQILNSASDLYNAIAEASTAALEREVEKQNKILDDQYKKDKERLEKELQDKLYQMGYIEAQTEEQHQRELELAIESGDQQRIYAAHSAYEKFVIEEEYAQKQQELEDKLAREKAELQYKLEMAQWQMKKINATATAAQGVLQAIAAPPGWPLNALFVAAATATGIAQRVAVEQAKPILQYSGGGIVPGTSYTGDKIIAGVNSREMYLNLDQQHNLFDAINGNNLGGGDVNATINLVVDGVSMAKVVAEKINNRQAQVYQRNLF